MSGKAERGKWRYIAFRVDCERTLSRRDFVGALLSLGKKSSVGDSFRLTVFEHGLGILKVPHRLKDDAIALLRSIDSVRGLRCEITTLKTSGTIRKLKDEYLVDDNEFIEASM
ncbi:MAG: Rpp14/Pop5 family protein [Methanobacteriota archaeon]|nr:MAG: Rpp14/Pop5 family protein [Euryarchaeota archaeon]